MIQYFSSMAEWRTALHIKNNMTLTQIDVDKILEQSTRCTQATLLAFGIKGYPLTGSGCLEYLTANGYTLEPIITTQHTEMRDMKCHARWGDSLLILTAGHVMALIDGILVDTAKQGFNRRRVEHAWLVTRSEEEL